MTFINKHRSENARFCFTIILLCLLWYACSSTASILNKIILNQFPFPFTITMSSLFGTSLYSIPVLRRLKIPATSVVAIPRILFFYLLPLACGKVVAVASSHFSLLNVPVSYAHTVKATMPLFSVICARLLLAEHQTRRVHVSLLPIVGGVIIATLTEVSFNMTGLLSALCSTLAYALLNAYVKKTLRDTAMHHVTLLSVHSQIACVIMAPVWFVSDVVDLWQDQGGHGYLSWKIVAMLAGSGLINCVQNLVTFTLIHKLTALSYSVANAAKRVVVIGASLVALRNPVSPLNVFGMLLAACGVLAYNQAKQRRASVTSAIFVESPTCATDDDAAVTGLRVCPSEVDFPGPFADSRTPFGVKASADFDFEKATAPGRRG